MYIYFFSKSSILLQFSKKVVKFTCDFEIFGGNFQTWEFDYFLWRNDFVFITCCFKINHHNEVVALRQNCVGLFGLAKHPSRQFFGHYYSPNHSSGGERQRPRWVAKIVREMSASVNNFEIHNKQLTWRADAVWRCYASADNFRRNSTAIAIKILHIFLEYLLHRLT